MKPIFRFAAAAWVVLFLVSGQSLTQEGPDEDPPELVAKEYAAQDLSTEELHDSGSPAQVQDVLALDRAFGATRSRGIYEWTLRASGHEVRCWDDAESALQTIAEFCAFADETWGVRRDDDRRDRVFLEALPAMHARVQWVLDSIRRISNARVSLRIHRLADAESIPSACLTAA